MTKIIHVSKQAYNSPTEFPDQIRGIIADLKSIIDQLKSNSENAKTLILELARRLNEGRLCERNQICRRIKDILKDKLNQGHITEKWIEDCLPEEYKRKYVKSEVSSLSKKGMRSQEMVIDNRGKVRAEMVSPKRPEIEKTPSLHKEQLRNLGGCPRCSELEEALRKASQISTAEELAEREIKIIIPSGRYEELNSAMQTSSDFFYIVFNMTNGSFLRADSDINDLI